jgi:hypothetical protein
MRHTLCRLAAFAFAVLWATAPRAEAPCLEDAARFCPGIPVGDGRLWPCLQRNQFQLSTACQQNLQEVRRRASEFNADCLADAQRFCPWTQGGGGRVVECLHGHVGRRELSTSCEEAVVTALEKLQAFVDACAGDAARLCEGVEAGRGQLFLCLKARSGELSIGCRAVVQSP